jgi:uncharacterized membrane protein YphA (DoxX/SURF4 family)
MAPATGLTAAGSRVRRLGFWKTARLIAAWVLGVYFAAMYIEMGWIKFDPNGFWTAAFVRWGYPPWMRIGVGVIEVVGGAMLLIPWVTSYGAMAVGLVMLGALATRLHDGRMVDSGWIAAYLAGLGWIAFEWRRFRLRP